jgi:hypothetical protein
MAQQTEKKLTLAAAAEAKCRAALSDPTQKIRYNSGSVECTGLLKRLANTWACMLDFDLENPNKPLRDPLTMPETTFEGLYTSEQRFGVMQPLVSISKQQQSLTVQGQSLLFFNQSRLNCPSSITSGNQLIFFAL